MAESARAVGFIGLGAMGLPMALHLVRAGLPVRGFDVNAQAQRRFAGRPTAGSATKKQQGN